MKRIDQLKPLALLIIFLAAWWLMPVVIKSFFKTTFYEFQAPVLSLQSHLRDLQNYWAMRNHSSQELIEANRDLARERAYYELNNQRIQALQEEIARLEDLLNLPSNREFRYEVARISQRDVTAWWQQVMIRKGKNHGIPEGAAVVYQEGIVGRVREVYSNSSLVELISSPGFRMAANIEGEKEPITYQGTVNLPFTSPKGEILNVPPEITLPPNKPKRVVSSELGGIFPQGLTIGALVELEPGPDGYFKKGKILLPKDLAALHEVAVIIPIQGDFNEN